jgi:outer membrane protein OmpA-like peptidoglycan-associated protein
MWYGKANPIASNSNNIGRALNRRVEIAVGGLM